MFLFLMWEVKYWSIETNWLCWETDHFLFRNIWYKQKRIGSHLLGVHHFFLFVYHFQLCHHFESFTVATTTWLTVMEYLCHKWPRICSTCREHFPVLSSYCLPFRSTWGSDDKAENDKRIKRNEEKICVYVFWWWMVFG
jgi:hypothetical protein